MNPFEVYVAELLAALGDGNPFDVLRETPAALVAAVSPLSGAQHGLPERVGKWSALEVVQHLADAELVGAFRFRMILAHDAPVLPGYDQNRWAERLHYETSDMATALQEFAVLRRANLRVLERATAVELQRVMRHSERGDESLGKMVRMYAGHDLRHLQQIARIRLAIGAA